jgi:peroxiredoxin Q/BCP
MLRSIAFVLVASAALGCGSEAPPTTASASASAATAGEGLKAGDTAPAVAMTLQDGKKVELASLKDKLVLVYFYPKDDTPGCTMEAQGVRDAWKDFQAAGIDVYGVSTQDAASHQAFIEKHDLPFPLVVDDGGAIATAFKVPLKNGNAARQSFLIGKDGKIKAVWPDVVPAEHAASVLAAAKS